MHGCVVCLRQNTINEYEYVTPKNAHKIYVVIEVNFYKSDPPVMHEIGTTESKRLLEDKNMNKSMRMLTLTAERSEASLLY
jgi:hypothetical protein